MGINFFSLKNELKYKASVSKISLSLQGKWKCVVINYLSRMQYVFFVEDRPPNQARGDGKKVAQTLFSQTYKHRDTQRETLTERLRGHEQF